MAILTETANGNVPRVRLDLTANRLFSPRG
jgi:hypothetical protein